MYVCMHMYATVTLKFLLSLLMFESWTLPVQHELFVPGSSSTSSQLGVVTSKSCKSRSGWKQARVQSKKTCKEKPITSTLPRWSNKVIPGGAATPGTAVQSRKHKLARLKQTQAVATTWKNSGAIHPFVLPAQGGTEVKEKMKKDWSRHSRVEDLACLSPGKGKGEQGLLGRPNAQPRRLWLWIHTRTGWPLAGKLVRLLGV